MFESERGIHTPTDEDEEEIQRQIAQDLDAPEWTDEDRGTARPDSAMLDTRRPGISPTLPVIKLTWAAMNDLKKERTDLF